MKISNEAKVGFLLVVTLFLGGIFAWILGVQSPFSQNIEYSVTYNFAGGIEVGSPVRVSGIKVGRVTQIDFFTEAKSEANGQVNAAKQEPGSENPEGKTIVPVRVKIALRRDAAKGIRQDSKFYINLAGIIGERYIEVTPGSFSTPELKTGSTVAGIDPPRIDQIFSQSFDLAGKISDIIEKNKGDLSKSVELIYKLSSNINETLAWVDKSSIFKTDLSKLVNNLIQITGDVRRLTDQMHTPEGEKTLKLLYDLLWRLEPIDSKQVREFLQKEGVKVNMF